MSLVTKRSREESECTCGCLKTSVWDCYNTNPDQLKQELKRTKITEVILESSHMFGIELSQDGDDWDIVHPNPEDLATTLHSVLKGKEIDAKVQSALDMLEDCKVEEVPIRAIYVIQQVNIKY
jgi:hypothetical protein